MIEFEARPKRGLLNLPQLASEWGGKSVQTGPSYMSWFGILVFGFAYVFRVQPFHAFLTVWLGVGSNLEDRGGTCRLKCVEIRGKTRDFKTELDSKNLVAVGIF